MKTAKMMIFSLGAAVMLSPLTVKAENQAAPQETCALQAKNAKDEYTQLIEQKVVGSQGETPVFSEGDISYFHSSNASGTSLVVANMKTHEMLGVAWAHGADTLLVIVPSLGRSFVCARIPQR
jgi:hypothetical protein